MTQEISFGDWLRKQRRALDLSRQAFASQVGCAPITLRRIEAGTLKPSRELAGILLEKLGIPEIEQLHWVAFARGISGLPHHSNPSSHKPITNLPASLTTFIGREKEQAEVIELITKHRLVTLTGSGGIGKTRLSLRVGEQVLENYADGVWLLELASLSDPALVPQTAAILFGLTTQSDIPHTDLLLNFLRTKSTLLILDNCEHLLDACAHLAETLLKNCPQLKILATSREPMEILGEALYRVPSLALPDPQYQLDALRDSESVKLFRERAQLVQFDFSLTLENASYIAQICQRLDGIPLAIELATAKVGMLSPAQIAKQLEESLSVLTGGARTALPRHQTLRASMDWSWGLLTEAEQMLMTQLSVFAGGWTLESARNVCEGDAFDLIGALIKKSLLVVDQEAERETRYRFHEIIHRYARAKLVEAGEEGNIRNRHLRYFLQFSEQAESGLRGPDQIDWYARLNDERHNIRTALERAAENKDVEAGLYLSGRLKRFWESFDLKEGIRWLAEFTDRPESKMFYRARAKALHAQVMLLIWMLQIERAYAVAQECLELYRKCRDPYGEIDGLIVLAQSSYNLDNLPQTIDLIQQALVLSESLGDMPGRAASLSLLASSCHDLQRSYNYFEQAISLNRQIKDWLGLADCLSDRGHKALLNGDLPMAEEYLQEATALHRQLKNKTWLGSDLQTYGRIAFSLGDSERALESIKESIEISGETGNRMLYLWSQTHLGYLTLRQGNVIQAREIFTESIREFLTEKMEQGVVFALEGMASLFIVVGKPEFAARLIGWADVTRKQIDDPRPRLEQADVDQIIAACHTKMGDNAFSDEYDEGQTMTLEAAVKYALEEGQWTSISS
jgi:non-specific serine/threonine protein kinase